MKIFDTYKGILDGARGAVVVIGNFDGVHPGHHALLDRARVLASDFDTRVALLSFSPHPRAIFRPDDPPFRITTEAMKAELLTGAAVDTLFSLPFNWEFASMSAKDFVQDILIDGLNAAHVVVGYDFKFGQMRKGTAETIRAAGLSVDVVDKVDGFSSTAIRQALQTGDVARANDLLGWDWEMRGVVAKGDQRGRDLGFPTANFELENIIHPRYGVYAARVQVAGEDKWRNAAINIGIRPMFEIPTARVESYVFDFDRDIYGQQLRVRPVKFLRGEAKFDSVDDLITQMDKDCALARMILEG